MAYSVAELQNILRNAGWPEELIVTMAAIGMAESSGNPYAANKSGEYSIGLWQINMRAHGTRYGTESQLYDPATNAAAALAIYQAQGLRAWGAYTDGRYRQYMPQSERAYNSPASPAPIGFSGDGSFVDFPSEGPNIGAIALGAGALLLILWLM